MREDYNELKAAKMETFSSYFNKRSLLFGCAVGAAVGLSYFVYRKWTASNGQGKVREKEESAQTRYG